MRTYLVFIIFIFSLAPAHADELAAYASTPGLTAHSISEPATDLSFAEANRLALSANPDIAVAIREREALQGGRIQAGVRPNPSVSALMEDTRNATRQTTLQLNQPLELGDKRARRIAAADARLDAATAAIDKQLATVHAEVFAAFYTVLAAQERVRLAQSSLDIARQAREAAGKRVQAGKVSPVEETRARVAESGVRIEASQATNQLNAARKRLTALWGNANPSFQQAVGRVDYMPDIPSLVELAGELEHAPAIRSASLDIATRQALTGIERSRRIPDLTVSVGARRNEELGLNQAVVGLSIPIPIFDRNQGNLQEAVSRTDQARDQLSALRAQLQADLSTAYERMDAARNAVQTLQTEILPDAESAYTAASKGFQYGKFGYLDVLDAQRTLFQAKTQYINALLEAHQGAADIERILGDVLPHAELAQQSIVPVQIEPMQIAPSR